LKTVEINKRIYLVPDQWNELTGPQIVSVMEVLYGDHEVNEALLRLLKIITGMKWMRWCRTPISEKMEFLYLTHFLINENNLTRQLLRQYRGYHGPDDDFNNLTGEEFIFSENFYFKSFTIVEENKSRQINEEGLNNLVAVLYRPIKPGYHLKKNPDGDPRVPFNQYISAYNAEKKIKRWPLAAKLAIFTWYECCRQNMISANPEIFTGGNNEPARYGLISVMRLIAEGGIHGDFDKVMKMYVKMWMIELNEKAEEAKQAEKTAT